MKDWGFRPRGVGPGLNLVRSAEARLAIVEVDGAMQAVMEALPEDLLVPHEEANRVFSVLSHLGEGISIVSPHMEGETEEGANAHPVLRLTSRAGAYVVELGVQPFGPEGRFFGAGMGPSTLVVSRAGKKVRLSRDMVAERRNAADLLTASPTFCSAWEGETLNDSAASSSTPQSEVRAVLGTRAVLDLLSELRAAEVQVSLSWPEKNPLRLGGSLSVGALRGGLRATKGWYLMSGSIALSEVHSISLAQLARAPAFVGGRYVQLPHGDFVTVDRKVRHLAALLSTTRVDSVGAIRLSDAQLLAIRDVLREADFSIEESVQARLSQFSDQALSTGTYRTPLRLNLRSYQKDGVIWLVRMGKWGLGACLADDMGLGKTAQIIAFLATRPLDARHLVVAPLSVCTNWVREIERFSPGLSVRDASEEHLKRPPAGVLVVSYGKLANSVESLSEIAWDTVVVDEAQFVKNPKTTRSRAVFSLRSQCRIAATGTPVENHLGDLWGIFRFLNPGLLGSWNSFSAHFVKPIERDGDSSSREALRSIVRPFILRRTKTQVLEELPERTHVRHELRLNEDEALRYAHLRHQVQQKLGERWTKRNKLEILAEITRLRRFCCHPRLVFPHAENDSPKLRALIPLVQELAENGHRALVFSQYVDFLTSVRERLAEHGLAHEYLDGSSSRQQRQEAIDRFSQGDAPLFVLSLKAGGTGLNLTAADYVIHLDPWWNPAVSAQATDRAHRIGQNRPVTVYEFVTADTIEEDIFRLHETKRGLSRAIVESDERSGEEHEELRDWLLRSLDERRRFAL